MITTAVLIWFNTRLRFCNDCNLMRPCFEQYYGDMYIVRKLTNYMTLASESKKANSKAK